MPWLSLRMGSSVTRLCSSGRSSQIADRPSRWPLSRRNAAWWPAPPRQQSVGLAGNGLRHRSDAAAELKGVATHETARRIGFVELFAPETSRRRAIAVGRLVHVAVGLRIWMEHQVLADQSAGIGKPVRKAAGGRIQEQPRRADAVTGDHNDFGGLKLLDTILVVVHDAGRH